MVRSEVEVDRLVRENEKLVQFVVNRCMRRYSAPGMEREDLVSWGMIGLVRAARAWDPERAGSFTTLACTVIERSIARGVRRDGKPEQAAVTLSLDSLVSGEESGEREESFLERLAGEQDVEGEILEDASRDAVRRAVAALPESQRRLIELHFYQDIPVAEAAVALGLSRQSAFERQRTALRKLRSALAPAFAAGTL
jgi:RNA polymerase sigma factor for flagellar operon FliA